MRLLKIIISWKVEKDGIDIECKNGDIQIENPTIGDWGNQGSVDGSIIM